MPQTQHRLENRATMLAGRIQGRRDMLASSLRAEGDRTLFTEHKPKGEALEWWRQHRNDKYGKDIINAWFQQDPATAMLQVEEMDIELAKVIEAERMYGPGPLGVDTETAEVDVASF